MDADRGKFWNQQPPWKLRIWNEFFATQPRYASDLIPAFPRFYRWKAVMKAFFFPPPPPPPISWFIAKRIYRSPLLLVALKWPTFWRFWLSLCLSPWNSPHVPARPFPLLLLLFFLFFLSLPASAIPVFIVSLNTSRLIPYFPFSLRNRSLEAITRIAISFPSHTRWGMLRWKDTGLGKRDIFARPPRRHPWKIYTRPISK